MSDRLVHLHSHGHFSLLDGVGTEKQRAERIAGLGQGALALTDHGSLSGAMHHYKACWDLGIVPILGVEAYFRPSRRPFDKETNWDYYHMVLLAKNVTGWRNLRLLTTAAYRSGFYRYPCIDLELLELHHEGLIVSTSCFQGYACKAVLADDEQTARLHLRHLKSLFGDDAYVALMPHDFDDQRRLNIGMTNLAFEESMPIVAEGDAHYPYPGWHVTQDIAVMIKTQQSFLGREQNRKEGKEGFEFHTDSLYLMSEKQMSQAFLDHHPDLPLNIIQEAIRNTHEIASRVVPISIDRREKLPRFTKPGPSGEQPVDNPSTILRQWAEEGLRASGKHNEEVYRERLEFELETFERLSIVEFFLITADMVRWARSEGIAVGPGRGSVGGSLVSKLIGITPVDPIAYGLLFERFINPDRRGMPDIDIDFDPDGAKRVKQYLIDKYGREKVVDLIAHGTFGSRSALKDVSRVFDIGFGEINAVTRSIDDQLSDEPLRSLIAVNTKIAQFAERHPDVFEHSCRLQGQVRVVSEHPAGVVLSDRPLEQFIPLMKKSVKDDYMITAFGESADFAIISYLGLLKIDILVIRELSKHAHALATIERREGETIDLLKLPIMDNPFAVDSLVMKNFCKGLTLGVWQFGSPGITNLVRQVQPENVLHLAAINALYRPGPLQGGMHTEYAARKAGRSFDYWHPAVEPYLKETFGIICFQEQVMQICQALGGFSLAEADDVRKIMSKEYRQHGGQARDRILAYQERFVAGAIERGVSKQFAEEIFDKVAGFSEYSFNLSHSVEYSLLSYMDMWLKTFYPDAFYAAQLSYPPSDPQRKRSFIEKVIREASMFDLKILPPDVNESGEGFTVTGKGIRFGLNQIKGIGPAASKEINQARPFTTVDEIKEKTGRSVTAGTIKSLANAGALDTFGLRDSLTEDERAEGEKDRLGTSLSGQDKIDRYKTQLEKIVFTEQQFDGLAHGEPIVVGGDLVSGKEIMTRRGEVMAKLELAFGMNTYRLTLFPDLYSAAKDKIDADEPLIARGYKDSVYDCVTVDEMKLASDLFKPESENGAARIKAEAFG